MTTFFEQLVRNATPDDSGAHGDRIQELRTAVLTEQSRKRPCRLSSMATVWSDQPCATGPLAGYRSNTANNLSLAAASTLVPSRPVPSAPAGTSAPPR